MLGVRRPRRATLREASERLELVRLYCAGGEWVRCRCS